MAVTLKMEEKITINGGIVTCNTDTTNLVVEVPVLEVAVKEELV